MSDTLNTQTLMRMKEVLPQFIPFFLGLFFGRTIAFNTREIYFDKIKGRLVRAPYVSPSVAGRPRRREGGIQQSFSPAYLKPTDPVTPDMLLERRPGEKLGGSYSPTQRRNLIRAQIISDQEKEINIREESMAVEAVLNGKIIVKGEDYPEQEVDYLRRPENDITLALPAQWENQDPATYDPQMDIEQWATRSTSICSILIFDKKAWALFIRFKKVQDTLDRMVRGATSSLRIDPQLESVVQEKGNYGNYRCVVYSGYFEEHDTNGDLRRVEFMPENTLLMAPGGYDGVMAYGAIQDLSAQKQGVSASPRFTKNWEHQDPNEERIQTQSAPLPIMRDADEFVVVHI